MRKYNLMNCHLELHFTSLAAELIAAINSH